MIESSCFAQLGPSLHQSARLPDQPIKTFMQSWNKSKSHAGQPRAAQTRRRELSTALNPILKPPYHKDWTAVVAAPLKPKSNGDFIEINPHFNAAQLEFGLEPNEMLEKWKALKKSCVSEGQKEGRQWHLSKSAVKI